MVGRLNKIKKDYSQKANNAISKALQQKKSSAEMVLIQKKQMEDASKIIEMQYADLKKKDEEIKMNTESFQQQMLQMRNEMEKMKEAYTAAEQSLAVVGKTPRVIHTHSNFQSLIDSTSSVLPSKRLRSDPDVTSTTNDVSAEADTTTISDSSSSDPLNQSAEIPANEQEEVVPASTTVAV